MKIVFRKIEIIPAGAYFLFICLLVEFTRNKKHINKKLLLGGILLSLLYGTSCGVFKKERRGTCYSVRFLENSKIEKINEHLKESKIEKHETC